jgi:hypothetical protein
MQMSSYTACSVLLPGLCCFRSQGEVRSIIKQLVAGHFVWQELVMGGCMLLLLLGLKAAATR